MNEVQCYCCQKFGHYAIDCYFNEEANENDKGVTQFSHAGSNDSEKVVLMADTQLDQEKINIWYLDI